MNKIVLSLFLLSLLAACASEKPKEVMADAKKSAGSTNGAAGTSVSASDSSVKGVSVDPLNDPNGILAKRSVYYPFDMYVVQDADKPVVAAHAKYLSQHANRKVHLEGNCDERGSEEYNLALGQRRADGVKKMLIVGGVKEGQIETVSYGEEKPKATGHDEESWKQNRRTDLNYDAK